MAAVEPDLEVLPTVDPECYGVAEDVHAFLLHGLRVVPLGPGADDPVAQLGLELRLEVSAAAGPEADVLLVLPGSCHRRFLLVHGTPSDGIAIRAAPTLRHYATEVEAPPEVHAICGEDHLHLIDVHVRIELSDVEARRDETEVRPVQNLGQRHDTARFHHITRDGLYGGDRQRKTWVALRHLAQVGAVATRKRGDLDGVAEDRAEAVRFAQVHIQSRDARVPHGVGDDLLLRAAVRRRQPGGGAVGVHRNTRDDAEVLHVGIFHLLAIDDVHVRLQGPCEDGLCARVAVRAGVEGEATALVAHPSHGVVLVPPHRREHNGGPDADAEVGDFAAALLLQRLCGEVECRHAGGRVRVNGHARPLQAEDVGDTVRHDATCVAGRTAALALLGNLHEGELEALCTCVDARRRIHELLPREATHEERRIAQFQHMPLAGVHALRLID
mmetsp:Transcript_54704/g.158921  ORF Transcript_54704/g.158921 Transcript_54704/m.158921 type:complete len:443 (-) Transcript_54704:1029-2357(-)